MRFQPFAYQQTAIDFIHDTPYAGLFLDMGMGKTVSTLTALCDLITDELSIYKALVVAPKRVAEDTWPSELREWDHLSSLRASLVSGTPAQREEALAQEADIYIVSRDNIAWLVDFYGKAWPFDVLVIDELSSFKSHSAKRFKQLRKVRPLIRRVIGLTGTPAPNGYQDMWAQIYLLDRGERLGKTVTEFRRRYFDQLLRPGYAEYKLKDGAKELIDAAIADICISMKARDHLDLKKPRVINRFVRLSPAEHKTYKTMEKDAILRFDDGTAIAALSAAAVSNKLLQLANGSVYDEDKAYRVIHDGKLDAMQEIIEEAQGEKLLVFYSYQADKERLLGRFPEARVLDTEADIRDWNDGKIKLLIAHPASCGHGLNLQHGGSIVVWFGLTWSLELYLQANARLDRQGQKNTVRIYHLLARGTIDELVLERLQGKNERQEELLARLKAELREG